MRLYIRSLFRHTVFASVVSSFVMLNTLPSCHSRQTRAETVENKPAKPSKKTPKDSFDRVSLIFAGDVMMHMPQITAAEVQPGVYDFESVFRQVAPFISAADIAVANLETTFGGTPYTGYPQFSTPDTLAWFLKRAGFDLIVTANNHSADRGTKGILGTIEGVERAGLQRTGTFRDSADRKKLHPFIMEKNGMRIAFLNYTYGTNGIPVHPPVIVNPIDTASIGEDIRLARQMKVDAVIPVFHWGLEYQREPNKEQKAIARYCLRAGADAIIGSHPHVLQPAVWEKYTRMDGKQDSGLVVYSLGNFISNQRKQYTDGGMLFRMVLKRNKFNGKITIERPSHILPTWVYIDEAPRRTYYILPPNSLQDSALLRGSANRKDMEQFLRDSRQHMIKRDSVNFKELE